MIEKSITIMIYECNSVCLAMNNSEQMAGLSATTRSWFGQNQVGGRNTNTWEMVNPINSMVLDPVQKKVNSSCS
jgi:hypothetical protein